MKEIDPKKLFNHRKNKYANQEDFAKLLPMKKTTYAGKEKSGKFTDDELKKIAKLLERKAADFYKEESELPTSKEEIAALKAAVKVLTLSVVELKSKVDSKSFASASLEIERMMQQETERLLAEGV